MTIPSRPAPAPPGSSAHSAVAGANASLEQLRLQLQQQQQFQQQNGGTQRITIKLPPPPKGPLQNGTAPQQHQHQQLSLSSSSSSITRKFPQARYSPATNWDDSPFDSFANGATTAKKVPPPRPPPPKVTANGRKATTAPPPPKTRPQPNHSNNIITNIFQRKHKQTKAPTPNNSNNSAARVYGLSSGISGSTNSINSTALYKATTTTTTTATSNYSTYSLTTRNSNATTTTTNNANVDWNAAWNTTATTTTTTGTTNMPSRSATPSQSNTLTATNGEPQLISFDSPPSSPTFTQKSNSDCVSVDSFSSDSNFSSPNNGSVSQPESGFEDDFSGNGQHLRSRPTTTSPLDPWESLDAFDAYNKTSAQTASIIGTAPVRNIPTHALRTQLTNNSTTDNPLCNGKSLLPPPPSLAMPTIIKPKISQKPKAPKPPVLHSKANFNGNLYASTSPTPLTPPSPAMPMCAPPPPPPSTSSNGGVSILDVISGKVDALALTTGSTGFIEEIEQPYGIALYDFDGTEEGDLSFRENEKIYLIEQATAEWYRGRTRSGCEGIFPVNYVDIKVPLAATNAISNSTTTTTTTYYQQQQQQTSQSPSPSSRAALPAVRCLYDFPADVAGDLPLKENDFVTILYRINEDWLFGEMHGRQGQFPANFLEYLPDNIP